MRRRAEPPVLFGEWEAEHVSARWDGSEGSDDAIEDAISPKKAGLLVAETLARLLGLSCQPPASKSISCQ